MLELRSVSTRYGERLVLDNVSLQVAPGQILALLGPNGAGKSTLIRTASGVLPPSHGSVWVAGREVSALPARQRARSLAVVPQARQLPGAFTVYQTVLLGRTPYLGWSGTPGRTDLAAVEAALESAGLTHMAERRVGELSGGEQQLVLLARALCQDTPVLLLDEPTTHLDLQHQGVLLKLLRTLAQTRQLAVLMVLHDLTLAGLYADQAALLVQGRIHAIGAPQAILTSQTLSEVYQSAVHVAPHPVYGTPMVLPAGIRD